MMLLVVYAIVNTCNRKQYIGSTTDPKSRKRQHFTDLRCGRHYNKHLQASFNKYGELAFQWTILERVDDVVSLVDRERFWILEMHTVDPKKGYNLTDEPYAPMRGKKFTEEQLLKLRKNHPKGSTHPWAKIDENTVEEIFECYRKGLKNFEIADKFGIHHTNVACILRGKSWKHLGLATLGVRTNNQSGCVGVYFQHNQNKWKAEIIRNKKYYNLGSYCEYEDAVKARKTAEENWEVYHRI